MKQAENKQESKPEFGSDLVVGAAQIELIKSLLKDQKVGVIANQTSMVGAVHLIDTLLAEGVEVVRIFAPEHGFRGEAANGAHIDAGVDEKSGLPISSLHGSHKKPQAKDLEGISVLVFDIQDVGARFYTYISSLHYVMEAAAENDIKVIVLDRPNPHGNVVDGPLLDMKYSSFVGMHPIPIIHGMTIGEYAGMINGEKWLADGIQCELEVVPVLGYDHLSRYNLPISPSPNLPNAIAIKLYPSLCLFEATGVSLGRGTEMPFQIIGYPGFIPPETGEVVINFTPKEIVGVARSPKHEGAMCVGLNLRNDGYSLVTREPGVKLKWLLSMFASFPQQDKFFTSPSFFDQLAGSSELRELILAGKTEAEIRATWEADLASFKTKRKKYLRYSDFE